MLVIDGRHGSVVLSKWVLAGSSKAVDAPCLAVFDLGTNSALRDIVSGLLGPAKKTPPGDWCFQGDGGVHTVMPARDES